MKPIYVHGLGQTSAAWEQTIRQLNGTGEAVCPSLADLAAGNKVSYQSLYAAFSNACNLLEGRLDLCGLSLGGVLALNYAIDHPEKVNSLVLIAAQYKMPKKLLLFQNAIFRLMPSAMFAQTGFGKAEFIQLCRTMAELDFSPFLRNVACPTLVVCGGKDFANKKASHNLAKHLQNAKLCVMDAVGHEVNIEAPERLAKQLQAFYAGVI